MCCWVGGKGKEEEEGEKEGEKEGEGGRRERKRERKREREGGGWRGRERERRCGSIHRSVSVLSTGKEGLISLLSLELRITAAPGWLVHRATATYKSFG